MTLKSGSCIGVDKEGTSWTVPMESRPWLALESVTEHESEANSVSQWWGLRGTGLCLNWAVCSVELWELQSPVFFFSLQPIFPTLPPVLFIPKHAVHKYICALAHVYSISKCILKWLSITVLSYKVGAAQHRITYWLCFWQSSSKHNKIMCLVLWVGKS